MPVLSFKYMPPKQPEGQPGTIQGQCC